MTETFQISLSQAEAYEQRFVPALFGQWAPRLVDLAEVTTGDRVLDVACGTGVVAREAVARTGPTGRVSGVDLNPAMIEVAGRVRPDLDWRVGDAEDLPFADDEFDRVLCQSALFFFPHPDRALGEMARVTARGGTVGLQTYAGLDEQPGYGPFVETVVRHVGDAARGPLSTYWTWGRDRLAPALTGAGFEVVRSRSWLGAARFASVEALVAVEVDGTPLAGILTPEQRAAVVEDLREVLREYRDDAGGLALPILADLAVAAPG